MILKDLLRQLDYEVIQGDENIEINNNSCLIIICPF